MDQSLQYSVLDQSPIPEGFSAGDALHNSLDLARHAERLGYKRFWIAEHHGTPGLASSSPEVLIGPVAAATSTIHVGSGGIMLPHYSPLKVAENFRMLAALYPGRIDLGIGRAAGTSPNVARQLQRDRRQAPPDDFPAQLDELLGLLNESAAPQVSILGSSPQSAIWAAERGLPYVFADFINAEGAEIAKLYRDRFRASRSLAEPYTAVALWAICAPTDDEAMRLSLSVRMTLAMMMRGRLIAIPSVERAEQFFQEQNISPFELVANRRFLTGSPETIGPAIQSVAQSYGAQEVFLVNILHSHAARIRSYELLSQHLDTVTTSRMTTTKVFRSGNSQAVRIPREFRIDAKEVEIIQRGDELILRKRQTERTLAEALGGIPALSEDCFAGGREQGKQEDSAPLL